MTTSRINPIAETKAYVDRVMATRGANLDEAGRTLLAEVSRSPCYEEVAVFGAFSRIIGQARSVLWSWTLPRPGTRCSSSTPRARITGRYLPPNRREAPGRSPQPRRHSIDAVAGFEIHEGLAGDARGATPISEAARLQEDLRRAQIAPYAWVINSSLAAAGSGDPCLKQRIAGELEQIASCARGTRRGSQSFHG